MLSHLKVASITFLQDIRLEGVNRGCPGSSPLHLILQLEFPQADSTNNLGGFFTHGSPLQLLIVPHLVPHNVPQWGTWGTCFIVPLFSYIQQIHEV